jgi:purine-nucleoside phosphorylase
LKEGEIVMELKEKIKQTTSYLTKKTKVKPQIGIILGTGLGELAEEIKNREVIPYSEIPNFPTPTITFHRGNLVFGKIYDKKVVAMEGRFHYYEGYSMTEITFPVRVMKELGIKILIVSNAAGGINKFYEPGDIMLIADHINFMGVNPLIGPNDEELGPRFPDMSNAYDKELIKLAEEVAIDCKIPLKKGVYIAVTGPNLETAAEYRFFSYIADAVGMSTVPEVIVAVHSGLKVLGFSVITDVAKPDNLQPTNLEEIIKISQTAAGKLKKLVKEIIRKIKI